MKAFLTTMLSLMLAVTASGQAVQPATTASLTPAALARVDSTFSTEMERYEIPGGALAIVENGELVHARGFGVEDLETKRAVDPERTGFYLASVTKPFTATAVMQLVERGKLDLHRDVNDYLTGLRIPAAFSEPVTLHHLLTHTAGFDDLSIGYAARSKKDAMPMGEYLAGHLPRRVTAPGSVTSYSNHGYGLAGHLVEIVSGETFQDYLESHILEPLGMSHSTAHTPPSGDVRRDLATGYVYNRQSGAMEPHPLGASNIPPAGTVIATPADVAKFMIAHLAGGEYAGARILRQETAELMQARQFTNHPGLPGIGYGFYERFRGEHRVIEHAGGYPGWATLMALVPERNTAIFLATNQSTSMPHYAALETLLNEMFGPLPKAESIEPPEDRVRLRRFAGTFQPTRYSRNTIEKVAILDTQVFITIDDEGFLNLSNRRDDSTRWAQVGPLLFRREDSSERIAFRENEDGEITHMFGTLSNVAFPAAFERASWIDRVGIQVPYMIVAAAIMASTITLAPLAFLIRWGWRRSRMRPRPSRAGSKAAWITAAFAGICCAAFIAGIDALLGNSRYRLQLVYGMTREMAALLWLPILLTLMTPVIAWFAVVAWRDRWWTLTERLYYSIVALTAVTFVVFLLNWRLLGFWY